MIFYQPGSAIPDMHRLEDPVTAQDAEVVGAEDGRLGWYDTATKHGNHSLRHIGSLPAGAVPPARDAPPVMVEPAPPSTLETCRIRRWRRYCAPGV
ncbi:hypothetical protein Raf01_05160 [Rugosimonospora africana]|uniref:Uncharacterized protein n=1 Tax=Rugosimonospora africana TaxID=556532 RepID=A0A8J3QJX0_9ACTN|nr:hypothetical protein Raf01_05160 [Rugosimonospora africana]